MKRRLNIQLVSIIRSILILSMFILSFAYSKPLAILNTNFSHQKQKNETILTFDINQPINFSSFKLKTPWRLVIDIPSALTNSKVTELSFSNEVIKGIRLGTQQGTDLRMVIDLFADHDASTELIKSGNVYQLVIKIKGQSSPQIEDDSKQITIEPPLQNVKQIVKEQTINQPKMVNKKQVVIAIDPGHGGKDPGAIGRLGSYEKNIVFAIAKQLKEMIDKQPNMKAVMTRNKDIFLPLRKRILIAKQHKADMFISIHADSGSQQAVGSSVYILSTKGASSEMARLLADRENRSDLIGNIKIPAKDEMVASMLLDLSIDATIESSDALGKHLLKSLKNYGKLHRSRIDRASFAVLKSPDIPSVLVETGFISNISEEKKLTSSSYQRKLAESIMSGIKTYFKERPAVEFVVVNQIAAKTSPVSKTIHHSEDQNKKLAKNKTNSVQRPTQKQESQNSKPSQYQVFSSGETLADIARKFNITEEALKKYNHLPLNQIRVPSGTILKIP